MLASALAAGGKNRLFCVRAHLWCLIEYCIKFSLSEIIVSNDDVKLIAFL